MSTLKRLRAIRELESVLGIDVSRTEEHPAVSTPQTYEKERIVGYVEVNLTTGKINFCEFEKYKVTKE